MWLGLVALVMPAGPALGAPGDLDTSFDGDGKRTIDYGGADLASAVALRPDGRIVMAGSGNPAADVAIQSLLPDGSGDLSFDLEGSLGIGLNGIDRGDAVALQPDGKILVAGSTTGSSGTDLVVLRVNPDGSPDTTFNGTGQRIIDYGGSDRAHDLALQPDGRIVIVGSGNAYGDVAIQRLLPDGSGDPSFDLEGSLGINLGGSDVAYAVALQPDGKILAAGSTEDSALNRDLVVLRVNPDGSPDPTFNGTGQRVVDYGGRDGALGLALQPDGRIVMVGFGNPASDVAVQRLLPDGSADPSFDLDGSLAIDSGSSFVGHAVALQPDGKIVVAGATANNGTNDFAVVRIQPGGLLDTTFNRTGKRIIDFAPLGGTALALAMQLDGGIVAAGLAGSTNNGNLAVARLQGDPRRAGGGGAGPGGSGAGSGVARCGGRAATIVGTIARDRLRGTSRADVIAALGGSDVIESGHGNDLVCSGAGNDVVLGTSGKDRLYGQSGKDRLLGGAGNDRLNGGGGKDRVAGGPGRDGCLGGPGRDRASCERERGI